MECRRWATTTSSLWLGYFFSSFNRLFPPALFLFLKEIVGLTGWNDVPRVIVGMRVSQIASYCNPSPFMFFLTIIANNLLSIVEYATREQAQHAVATLSNQNLMGRLVYVREVCLITQTRSRLWQSHEPLALQYQPLTFR